MSEIKPTRTAIVTNREGIHVRAATMIAELVRRFESEVVLIKNHERVSGDQPLQILLLTAAQGDQVTLEAQGPDAEQALDSLLELFADNFGDDQEETEQAENQS